MRNKKWAIRLGIVGGVVILLVVGGVLGWRALMNYFVQQYYQQTYQPLALEAGLVGDYPPERHLNDVPWIAVEESLCQSTSLQMIAAQWGIEQPRRYFDFLMGFTYGVSGQPGGSGFFPGTDPEAGFAIAAPYLGLVRRYYTTDDAALYLRALRYFLAQGRPVRVGLDYGLLYGMDEQLPHSDVLVGYDAQGFFYYETVCVPPAPCQAGQRPPGEEGLYVTDAKLLEAVLSQAKVFSYSWRYSFTIFEAGPRQEDLGPVWERNGQSLIGGAQYGPRSGADVIEGLADTIEKEGAGFDVAEIRPGLETAVYVRGENATYLRERFGGEAEVERAAALFDQAAGDYAAVLEASGDGIAGPAEAEQVAGWLRDAAAAEREIGRIFVALATPTVAPSLVDAPWT